MSYLVVGTRSGEQWSVDVQGVGRTTSAELGGIEAAARVLLATEGRADAETVDLQLLLPDFEVDLDQHGLPFSGRPHREIVAGLILLVVVVGAAAFVLGRLLG